MRLSDPYNVSELKARSIAIAVMFCILLGVLLIRLWYLQIWMGTTYRDFSDRNRFKIERLAAPRGQLLDREGRLLADSRPRFDVDFIRSNAIQYEYELRKIGQVLHWSEDDFQKRLQKINDASPYQTIQIAQDISFEELGGLESQSLDIPSVDIETNAVRDYLFSDAFFHSLGYTREIGPDDLKTLQMRFPERNYKSGDQKGMRGIEEIFEGLLRGQDGRDFIVVDVRGRRVNTDDWHLLPKAVREDPIAGKTMRLSLDLDLQMAGIKAFGEHIGAAVALDPETGEVLAYVSKPGLDPNAFTKVISTEDYRAMQEGDANPFLDRVAGAKYAPGSTLKLVMAAAALETGVISPTTTFFCPGSYRFGGNTWKCHLHSGHGTMNVVSAIEQSCDVFFYNTGFALGLDSMFAWSSRFGLGRATRVGNETSSAPGSIRAKELIRFNSELEGRLPSVEYVRANRQTTVEAESINASIGQGSFEVTAMQLARMVAAIGNGGKVFQPQLVLDARSSLGGQPQVFKGQLETQFELSPQTQASLLRGMELVIEGSQGTARLSKLPGIKWGGKTGTAQVVAMEFQKLHGKKSKEYEDHALFVGLSPLDHPKIAVAVIAEHGGHGSSAAAPVAKAIVKAFMDKRAASEAVKVNQAGKEEKNGAPSN